MEIFTLEHGNIVEYNPFVMGYTWYVMYSPDNKGLKVREYLASKSIEAIVPLQYQEVVRRGKVSIELAGTTDSLIYIYANKSKMFEIKRDLPYLRYAKSGYPGGAMEKVTVNIDREVVDLYRLLENNYQSDMVIVSDEDVWDDNYTCITPESGIFKDIPLIFENVKGLEHKCLTMNLSYGVVVAIKSLTPESFMSQPCHVAQTINGEFIKTHFTTIKVAN